MLKMIYVTICFLKYIREICVLKTVALVNFNRVCISSCKHENCLICKVFSSYYFYRSIFKIRICTGYIWHTKYQRKNEKNFLKLTLVTRCNASLLNDYVLLLAPGVALIFRYIPWTRRIPFRYTRTLLDDIDLHSVTFGLCSNMNTRTKWMMINEYDSPDVMLRYKNFSWQVIVVKPN